MLISRMCVARPLYALILLLPVAIAGAEAILLQHAYAQASTQPTRNPRIVLGRKHPGRVTSFSDGGIAVDLKDGGTQVVQFGEIWRIRRAFASDEPPGTTVIDFADNRLFVATPLANLVADTGKKIPLVPFTAPNGEVVYMAAKKVTDTLSANVRSANRLKFTPDGKLVFISCLD